MWCGVLCCQTTLSSLSASTQTSPAISVGSRAHLQEDAVANVCVCACVRACLCDCWYIDWFDGVEGGNKMAHIQCCMHLRVRACACVRVCVY